MSQARSTFPPAARLHDQRDYSRVFNRQQKHGASHVVALLRPRAPGEAACGRLGVMVSTKVAARAVRRHQLKRWVRELFRRELAPGLAGWDLVILFRRDPPPDGHQQLDGEVREAIAKARAHAPGSGGGRRPRGGGEGGGGSGTAPARPGRPRPGPGSPPRPQR
jgi:ribonuclease P protein component